MASGLNQARKGHSVAYLDWKSQEIAIAAASSEDDVLWQAYATGDPYLAFAVQAGMAPEDAAKETHKEVRERCKDIVLGVQWHDCEKYGA